MYAVPSQTHKKRYVLIMCVCIDIRIDSMCKQRFGTDVSAIDDASWLSEGVGSVMIHIPVVYAGLSLQRYTDRE